MPRAETHSRKLERELRKAPEHQLKIARIRELLGPGPVDVRKAVKGLEKKGGLRLERDGHSWDDPDATVTLLGPKGRATSAAGEPRVPRQEKKTYLLNVFDYTGDGPFFSTHDIPKGVIFFAEEHEDWIPAGATVQYYCADCGQTRVDPFLCPRCGGTTTGRIDLLPSVRELYPPYPYPTSDEAEAEPLAVAA